MRILIMYATLMPVVIAGAANMLFTKTRLYRETCVPIDGGKCCADGKRIFGDNKTWAGFFGMIAANCIAQILWGLLSLHSEALGGANELYRFCGNTLLFNAAAGALFGLVYVLFELPNSFLKRRLDIQPGKDYYIRTTTQFGVAVWRPQIDVVPAEAGKAAWNALR